MVKSHTQNRAPDSFGNTGYNKVIQQMITAATRIGLEYDYDEQVIYCPRCNEEWETLQCYRRDVEEDGYQHPKDCDKRGATLGDYMLNVMPKETMKNEIVNKTVCEEVTSKDVEPVTTEVSRQMDSGLFITENIQYPDLHFDFKQGVKLPGRIALFFAKDTSMHYKHTGAHYKTLPWPEDFNQIPEANNFNTALVQVFDGTRVLPYHKDNEPCYDTKVNEVTTINLCGTAELLLSKDRNTPCETIALTPGSAYVMPPNVLRNYYHGLRNISQGRVSITFRWQNTSSCVDSCGAGGVFKKPNKQWIPRTIIAPVVDQTKPLLETLMHVEPGLKPIAPLSILIGSIHIPLPMNPEDRTRTINVAKEQMDEKEQETHDMHHNDQSIEPASAIHVMSEIQAIPVVRGHKATVQDAKMAKAVTFGLHYDKTTQLYVCPKCDTAAVLAEHLANPHHDDFCARNAKATVVAKDKIILRTTPGMAERCVAHQGSVKPEVATLSHTRQVRRTSRSAILDLKEDHIITHITHPSEPETNTDASSETEHEQLSEDSLTPRKRVSKKRKITKPTPVRPIVRASVVRVITDIIDVCMALDKPCEIIGKTKMVFEPRNVAHIKTVGIRLHHHDDPYKFHGSDIPDGQNNEQLLTLVSRALQALPHAKAYRNTLGAQDVRHGHSGAIIPQAWFKGGTIHEGPIRECIIVRGRNKITGNLVNALNQQDPDMADEYDQYSTIPDDTHNDLMEFLTVDDDLEPSVSATHTLATLETLKADVTKLEKFARALNNPIVNIPTSGPESLFTVLVNRLQNNTNSYEWGTKGDSIREFVNKHYMQFPMHQVPNEAQVRRINGDERHTAHTALMLVSDILIMKTRRLALEHEPIPQCDDCVYYTGWRQCLKSSCVTCPQGRILTYKYADPAPNCIRIRGGSTQYNIPLPLSKDLVFSPESGMCYLTVFLHMYLTIPEANIKRFQRALTEVMIPKLGKWPTMSELATCVLSLIAMFPTLSETPMPPFLVCHSKRAVHVVDCLGNISLGYHQLNISTAADFSMMASTSSVQGCGEYNVGGFKDDVKRTLKCIRSERALVEEMTITPTWLFYALASPTLLKILHRSKIIDKVYVHVLESRTHYVDMILQLSHLCEKISRARSLDEEIDFWVTHVGATIESVSQYLETRFDMALSRDIEESKQQLKLLLADATLHINGHASTQRMAMKKKENVLIEEFRAVYRAQQSCLESTRGVFGTAQLDTLLAYSKEEHTEPVKPQQSYKDMIYGCVGRFVHKQRERASAALQKAKRGAHNMLATACANVAYTATKTLLATPVNWASIFNMYSCLVFVVNLCMLVQNYRREQKRRDRYMQNLELRAIAGDYYAQLDDYAQEHATTEKTFQEIKATFDKENPHFIKLFKEAYMRDINFQSADEGKAMCKFFAVGIMIMMVFDCARADLMYKTFSQVKALFNTIYDKQNPFDITFQADKDASTIMDVIIQEPRPVTDLVPRVTFGDWFRSCVDNGRSLPVIPDVPLLDFTRATAHDVVAQITGNQAPREVMVRGFVGSGKSTYLPHLLSATGKVLICEPVRVLASNVYSDLMGHPFFQSPTLQMRGDVKFGSGPITVATSGFAAVYFNSNRAKLNDFQYIMFDEAHSYTSATLVLRSILKAIDYRGTILHVSATPPGKEIPFKTMHSVVVENTTSLSFDDFAAAQGKGTKWDVKNKGANILVYVASFNDVDRLAKVLSDHNNDVLKVDSRTIINASRIDCTGTPDKPLYLIATNIVENGVTLDVDVVVDFGTAVKPKLNTLQRRVDYEKVRITYGQRIQRNGRVGRFKSGYCLNIGDVYRAPPQINDITALEAAAQCFVANVNPPFDNVEPGIFSHVTREQLQTAMSFELPMYLTVFLIAPDGSMQKGIFNEFKKYLIRDTVIKLTPEATYLTDIASWRTLQEYFSGDHTANQYANSRVPFYVKDFGEHSYYKLSVAIKDALTATRGYKGTVHGDVTETAILLQTDPTSIDRSIQTICNELAHQRQMLESIKYAMSNSVGLHYRLLSSITTHVRGRYQGEVLEGNIKVLEHVRDRLTSLKQTLRSCEDEQIPAFVNDNPDVTMVINFQSDKTKAKSFKILGVMGIYDYTRIASDVFGMCVTAGVVIYFICKSLWSDMQEQKVTYEGKKGNRLRMRDHKDARLGYSLTGQNRDIVAEFGEEYSTIKYDKYSKNKPKPGSRPKSMPRTNMGKKVSPFQTFYNFDPADYDILDLYDPVTGLTVAVDPRANAYEITRDVEDAMPMTLSWADQEAPDNMKARFKKMGGANKDVVIKQLEVDMTKHVPTLLTPSGGIQGYPEHRGEFRQTGQPKFEITTEAKSMVKSGQNIQPFTRAMGTITVHTSNGETNTTMCTQIGQKLLLNAHLFDGIVTRQDIRLQNNFYQLNNQGQIRITHVEGMDIVIQTLPADVPPAKKLSAMRFPMPNELIRLLKVKRTPQNETIELSDLGTAKPGPGLLWYHNITTVKGDCGALIIADKDNKIVGIHTGHKNDTDMNLFTPITQAVIDTLSTITPYETHDWVFTPDMIYMDNARCVKTQPGNPFPIARPLSLSTIFQSHKTWVSSELPENIRFVCTMPTFFNTRHTISGENDWFIAYLNDNPAAKDFFTPLMNHYLPSNLNGEAFKKDFFKYGAPVKVGDVCMVSFQQASDRVKRRFEDAGFEKHGIPFEFDPLVIRDDLNKQAAMGAQYVGKKEQHLESITDEQFTEEFECALYRLLNNLEGVWKGSLKAELRPLAKVQANKTRVFTSAPYDVLIAGKACVMHFNKQFYAANTNGPWTVGINKLNRGWDKMLRSLPDGWVYGTGDGSQFDSSLTPLLINEVCKIRQYFMEDNHVGQKLLPALYRQIIWTLISMPDGTVVRKAKGNPSGQPSTVDDNTMMVMLAVEYVFSYLGISYEETNKYFKYYANGDDIIFAIHPDKQALLDEFGILFSHLGLNYIFEERTTQRSELEYMSLQGIERDGLLIPKLCKERIVSIVQWARKGECRARFDALNAAILESWGYDDLTYWLRHYLLWLLENNYSAQLQGVDVIPYHTETAIQTLYTCDGTTTTYDGRYDFIVPMDAGDGIFVVDFQADPTPPAVTNNPPENQRALVPNPLPSAPDTPIVGSSKSTGVQPPQQQPSQVPRGSRSSQLDRYDLNALRSARSRSLSPIVRADEDELAPHNQTTEGEQDYEELKLPDTPHSGWQSSVPTIKGKKMITYTQMYGYRPQRGSLHNNKATDSQLEAWQNKISKFFNMPDPSALIMGFMAYCIENGTSEEMLKQPSWVMADKDGNQREYSMEPFRTKSIELRKIMRRFTQQAVEWIQIQMHNDPDYIPRMAAVRNIRKAAYYPYVFDFVDTTVLSPEAREIAHQCKAAALAHKTSKVLGLDGGSATDIDTERHTVDDATARTHNVRGTALTI